MYVGCELGRLSLEKVHLHETATADEWQIFELLAELTAIHSLLDLLRVDVVLDQLGCLVELGLVFAQPREDLHPASSLLLFDFSFEIANDHLSFDDSEEALQLGNSDSLALKALSEHYGEKELVDADHLGDVVL